MALQKNFSMEPWQKTKIISKRCFLFPDKGNELPSSTPQKAYKKIDLLQQ